MKRTTLPFRAERLDDAIVTAFGDPPGGQEVLGPEHARRVVREAWSCAESRRRLVAAYLKDRGVRHDFASSDAEDDSWLPRILRAVEDGRLLLWRTERNGGDGGEWGEDLEDPNLSSPAVGTTWVELRLVDDRGGAVAHEPYELITPDRQHRSGRLDERGTARLEGLEAGSCQIWFPRIDGREWGPSIPAPALPGNDATSHLRLRRGGLATARTSPLGRGTGKEIFDRLTKSGKHVTIREGKAGECTAPFWEWPKDKQDTVIEYDPDDCGKHMAPDGKAITSPPQITLAHELIHSMHYAEGTRIPKGTVDPEPPVTEKDIEEEEAATIGTGSHADDFPTENSLRHEWGLPPRVDHKGYEALDDPAEGPTSIRPGKY